MKLQHKIATATRAQTGRSASRRLRKSNKVPAILYGKHTAPEKLHVDGPEFTKLLKGIKGTAVLIELQKEKGDSAISFLQEVQRDPITDKYLHIDFQEVKENEKFDIRVRVTPIGEAHGVKNQSGVLETPNPFLLIRCLPKDLPPLIGVDVSELKIGDTLHVGSLKPIAGVEFRDDKKLPVFSCVQPVEEIVTAVAAAAPVEGAAAAPGAAGATPAAGAAAAPGAAGAAPAAGGAAPAAGAAAPAAAGAKPAAGAAAGAKPAAAGKK